MTEVEAFKQKVLDWIDHVIDEAKTDMHSNTILAFLNPVKKFVQEIPTEPKVIWQGKEVRVGQVWSIGSRSEPAIVIRFTGDNEWPVKMKYVNAEGKIVDPSGEITCKEITANKYLAETEAEYRTMEAEKTQKENDKLLHEVTGDQLRLVFSKDLGCSLYQSYGSRQKNDASGLEFIGTLKCHLHGDIKNCRSEKSMVVSEILDLLPDTIGDYYLSLEKDHGWYVMRYKTDGVSKKINLSYFEGKTAIEAAQRMLDWFNNKYKGILNFDVN
jgi:hypothetical protein